MKLPSWLPSFKRSAPTVSDLAAARRGDEIRSSVALPSHAKAIASVGGGRLMLRMFDAAVVDNLSQDFPVAITSANAEILVSAIAARSRARRLERDNPYAVGIINTMQNNVCGHEPFRLEMKVGKYADGVFVEEAELNRAIEKAWTRAGTMENFSVTRDMTRSEGYWQAISAIVRDGGILWRHERAFPKNRFGYAVETIEVDRLDHWWNRPAVGTANEIQFGVERDKWHGVEAYYILSRHPGDVFAWSSSPRYRERVPERDVICAWDIRTRAGQYVAVPRFSSVIKRLHRIDQYDIAEATAAIWSACKPVYLKRPLPTVSEYTGDLTSKEGEKIAVTTPGEAEILPDGYEAQVVDPKHPVDAYTDFVKQNLRGVSAGAGIAYHTLTNDLSEASFSSGRIGIQAEREEFKKLQEHMKAVIVRPHFNAWLKYAILSGEVKADMSRLEELQEAAVFHARRWPYIDPVKDAQADVIRIKNGLDSRQRVISESERGGDVETVNAEQASDKASDERHGLDFSGVPTEKAGADDDDEAPPAEGGKRTPRAKSKLELNGHGR